MGSGKSKKKDASFPSQIMLILVFAFIVCCMVYGGWTINTLHVGMWVLWLIVFYYVITGVLYLFTRRRIKKEISFMPEVSQEKAKELFNKNKYKRWFQGANYGLFAIPTIVFCVICFIVGDLSTVAYAGSSVYRYVNEIFTEPETAVVTYVNETKRVRVHVPNGKSNTPKEASSYRVVNFQTSDGEFLTLLVWGKYLEEVRTYENTEINYRYYDRIQGNDQYVFVQE